MDSSMLVKLSLLLGFLFLIAGCDVSNPDNKEPGLSENAKFFPKGLKSRVRIGETLKVENALGVPPQWYSYFGLEKPSGDISLFRSDSLHITVMNENGGLVEERTILPESKNCSLIFQSTELVRYLCQDQSGLVQSIDVDREGQLIQSQTTNFDQTTFNVLFAHEEFGFLERSGWFSWQGDPIITWTTDLFIADALILDEHRLLVAGTEELPDREGVGGRASLRAYIAEINRSNEQKIIKKFSDCEGGCELQQIYKAGSGEFLFKGVYMVPPEPTYSDDFVTSNWYFLSDTEGTIKWQSGNLTHNGWPYHRVHSALSDQENTYLLVSDGILKSITIGPEGQTLDEFNWPFGLSDRITDALCRIQSTIERSESRWAFVLQCDNVIGHPESLSGNVWNELVILGY